MERLEGRRKVYVASSWRNRFQPGVVAALRSMGHEVYDFRHPAPDNNGFQWRSIDPEWAGWTIPEYKQALASPIAQQGFKSDYDAMQWADTGVLVLPSGRSSHLEAGYFVGAQKPLLVLLPQESTMEPELMYLMAHALCVSYFDLLELFEVYRDGDSVAAAEGSSLRVLRA